MKLHDIEMRNLLVIAGLLVSTPLIAGEPRPISKADQIEIQRQADLVLFDGQSVRWRWSDRIHEEIYCSHYNAKNRLGAYVGWQPFFFFDGKVRLFQPGDNLTVYEALCGSAGYAPKADWLPD